MQWLLNDIIATPSRVPLVSWLAILFFYIIFAGIQYLLGQSHLSIFPQWYKSWRQNQKEEIDRKEIQSRMVSTLHALIVGISSSLNLIFETSWANNGGVHLLTDFQRMIFCLSTAYFIADGVFISYYRIGKPMLPIQLHHLFSAWAFLVCLGEGTVGTWYGVLLLTTEMSTPPNNLFWFLTHSSLDRSNHHRLVNWVYGIFWIIFRTAITPFIIWRLYSDWEAISTIMTPYVRFILLFNITFLIILNTLWLFMGPWPWKAKKENQVKTKDD